MSACVSPAAWYEHEAFADLTKTAQGTTDLPEEALLEFPLSVPGAGDARETFDICSMPAPAAPACGCAMVAIAVRRVPIAPGVDLVVYFTGRPETATTPKPMAAFHVEVDAPAALFPLTLGLRLRCAAVDTVVDATHTFASATHCYAPCSLFVSLNMMRELAATRIRLQVKVTSALITARAIVGSAVPIILQRFRAAAEAVEAATAAAATAAAPTAAATTAAGPTAAATTAAGPTAAATTVSTAASTAETTAASTTVSTAAAAAAVSDWDDQEEDEGDNLLFVPGELSA
jgi:hypothetical protein